MFYEEYTKSIPKDDHNQLSCANQIKFAYFTLINSEKDKESFKINIRNQTLKFKLFKLGFIYFDID